MNLDSLKPKRPGPLRVLQIGRISTLHQDPRSVDDQRAYCQNWLAPRYVGPIEWTYVAGQGSGESVERQAVLEAERLVSTGDFDVVILEDLGRHLRRIHAVLFCELCEDHETRLIAINDDIDTAGDWRLHAFFAALKHETSNRDTASRIRRSLRNRFQSGGVVQTSIYGYVKAPGAMSDDDLQKDPAAEAIYDQWFRMLEDGASYSEVADWLNQQEVPTGPYCRSKRWTPQMVARITRNPILKGVRVRNERMSRRVNQTGRRKSVKAPPEERLERCCQHLVFIEPSRWDRVIRLVNHRNAHFKRKKPNGIDPRHNVAKKKTVWPGQHLTCGICGRILRYGGHGQADHLLCRGAYEYRCWQAASVDGPLAGKKILEALYDCIAALPEFEKSLNDRIAIELRELRGNIAGQLAELVKQEQDVLRRLERVREAIQVYGHSLSLLEDLRSLESEAATIDLRRTELEATPQLKITLPPIEEIRAIACDKLSQLAGNSQEFGRLMRKLIPQIVIVPVRSVDGGGIHVRAKFTFDASYFVPNSSYFPTLASLLQIPLVVNLFKEPQRIRLRADVVALRTGGMSAKLVAEKLGVTVTAVNRTMSLQRKMDQLGISDPYQELTEPPMDDSKFRRHLHPRYRFEPLDSDEDPPLAKPA